MPELEAAGRRWSVAPASNLLDALNAGGCRVPFSCRAGSCHACLVRVTAGEPADARPDALDAERREQGWRLACQCLVVQDLAVELFDPQRDGIPARVAACDWLGVRCCACAWNHNDRCATAPASTCCCGRGGRGPALLAGQPAGETPWLEFHIDCRAPGAFCNAARALVPGMRCAWASCAAARCTTTRPGMPGRC